MRGLYELFLNAARVRASFLPFKYSHHHSVLAVTANCSRYSHTTCMRIEPAQNPIPGPAHGRNSRLQDLIEEVTKTKQSEFLDVDDWKQIYGKWKKPGPSFFVNVLTICYHAQNVQLADSLMEYVTKTNTKLDIIPLCYFIQVLGKFGKGDAEIEKKTVHLYSRLSSEFGLTLPPKLASAVVEGLSCTVKWRECLNIMNGLRMHSQNAPSRPIYQHMAIAAFENRENQLAWQLLFRLTELETYNLRNPISSYLLNLIGQSHSEDIFQENFANYLNFLKRVNRTLREPIAMDIKATINSIPWSSWKCQEARVTRTGRCVTCGGTLPDEISVTDADCNKLLQALETSVIQGGKVWRSTTPREFQQFVTRVKDSSKYDYVIDGPNVALTTDDRSVQNQRNRLRRIVEAALNRSQRRGLKHDTKILLVGKKHMHRLNLKLLLHEFRDHVNVFLTEDISKDDLYILYAAFHSGNRCFVVSSDNFQDAQSKISKLAENRRGGDERPNLTELFVAWRYTHLLHSRSSLRTFNDLVTVHPRVQFTDNSIHIPYELRAEEESARILYEFPKHWLCATKLSK